MSLKFKEFIFADVFQCPRQLLIFLNFCHIEVASEREWETNKNIWYLFDITG